VTPEARTILTRFRLLARARIVWLHHLRADTSEVDLLLDDADSPEAESDWIASQDWAGEWMAELQDAEGSLAGDPADRLTRLRQIFGIDDEECDLLQACLAVSLDPSLLRLCAYLQDRADREFMTEELAARLYRHGRRGTWSAQSAVYRWALVVSRPTGAGDPHLIECDPQIRDWLLGQHTLQNHLVGVTRLREEPSVPDSWPLQQTAATLETRLSAAVPGRLRVAVQGARGSGRRTFAAAVSARLRMPMLEIDVDGLGDAEWREVYVMAQRQAYLDGCAVCWSGELPLSRAWPRLDAPFPLQFVTVDGFAELPAVEGLTDIRVRMPHLSVEERSALWQVHIPASRDWPEEELRELSERYPVYAGDIAAVAEYGVTSAEEAAQRVREASRGRLGNLAQWLRCGFEWDDLVASPGLKEALEDIVYEANHRVTFWEQATAQRLFPQGQGLMALLSGPPGTGKTMAAQVVAGKLGYDLFRVDLAGVVSKWVGETSQNFERILTRAADMHAILLFDECDAIFSKRTTDVRDAQDKFANTDAAYLLQAIEDYPGIALMATNQKGNIDPAFIRRLRYVLEFSRPDAAQRLEIWRKVVMALAGEDRVAVLEDALRSLAEGVDATGAQIKFATLGAVFAARRDGVPLEPRHLLRGLDRELGKDGRVLGPRERERMLSRAG
jgi:adenylate kinase family enzyme